MRKKLLKITFIVMPLLFCLKAAAGGESYEVMEEDKLFFLKLKSAINKRDIHRISSKIGTQSNICIKRNEEIIKIETYELLQEYYDIVFDVITKEKINNSDVAELWSNSYGISTYDGTIWFRSGGDYLLVRVNGPNAISCG